QAAIRKGAFDQDVLFNAYDEFETIGREVINGQSCWNVRMTGAETGEVTRCFSTETGLQVAATEAGRQLLYAEYREIDGLKYPAVMTGTVEGQSVTMTLKSVSHAPLPPETFALPADVKALVN
ncbi:MAG TPA: DUF4412 domain-containing protein, partial [Longimicrobium sp.]|nr:DUF4412 domain-containing protein [Longimicrobium sp.]